MNRQLHQLINERRFKVVKAPPKPQLPRLYEPKPIESAMVDYDELDNPESPLALDGVWSPMECKTLLEADAGLNILLVECVPCPDLAVAANQFNLLEVTAHLHTLVERANTLSPETIDQLIIVNAAWTDQLNAYIKYTIDPGMEIDSVAEDLAELVITLEQKGYSEIATLFSALTVGGGLVTTGSVAVGSRYMVNLAKSTEEMGFSEIGDDVAVRISRVWHPYLIDMLDRISGYNQNIYRVQLNLLDDIFIAYRSPLADGMWSIVRG